MARQSIPSKMSTNCYTWRCSGSTPKFAPSVYRLRFFRLYHRVPLTWMTAHRCRDPSTTLPTAAMMRTGRRNQGSRGPHPNDRTVSVLRRSSWRNSMDRNWISRAGLRHRRGFSRTAGWRSSILDQRGSPSTPWSVSARSSLCSTTHLSSRPGLLPAPTTLIHPWQTARSPNTASRNNNLALRTPYPPFRIRFQCFLKPSPSSKSGFRREKTISRNPQFAVLSPASLNTKTVIITVTWNCQLPGVHDGDTI